MTEIIWSPEGCQKCQEKLPVPANFSQPVDYPPQGLDKSPRSERKWVPDAGNDPAQGDIEHLCRVWAEVGLAILTRRQRTDEQEDLAQ